MARALERQCDALRPISMERGIARYAEGSCLVKFGNTHVYCTASIEDKPPLWLRGQGKGWISAEYAMLPRATHSRNKRDGIQGKSSGRTHEIQRLIGRSLRAVTDLTLLGERQIILDCDVIQADGGTRTAAITGSWVALHDCCNFMEQRSMIRRSPLKDHVVAVACGLVANEILLDLDYNEDSIAETDANFVMTGTGALIEIQASAEKKTFSEEDLAKMMSLARGSISQLVLAQKSVLSS